MPGKGIGRIPRHPASHPIPPLHGSPLTHVVLITKVQKALQQAGLNNKNYNGQSFRIGAATSAAQRGLAHGR